MAKITSAYLGDEVSSQNITKSLEKRITDGKINVLVDSSLIPIVTRPEKIEISDQEKEEIRNEAEKECGNANDSNCIEGTKSRLQQSRLEEKQNELNSSANLVKGRRLTVNYIDANGKKQTAIVPEGQYFKMGEEPGSEPIKATQIDFELPGLGGTALELFKILSVIVLTFLFAASVALTYKTTILSGYSRYIAYGLTAAAVFIPYSGFFISLLVAAVAAYMESKKTSA